MPTVTIEHADGSTETIPQTTKWTRTREVGTMRRAQITVERALAQSVSLNEKRDLVHLGEIDTFRLVDVQTGGSTWTLVCYSLEWDANREPYTSGGDEREGTDDELITNLVGEVASWTAGTITNQSGPLSFVFNHAHQHEAIRRIEKNVPGEIRFRDEGTVDYVSRLGSDRSASVELSASAGTIEDEITITKRGRELDGTHIRVLGAHEGEAQYFANLVPQDDPDTYENEVRYSTPRWSDASDTDWDRWENKDVTDQATIVEEAESLADEITSSLVEAKATTNRTDLNVGDSVSVVKSDADLNRSMRVHRIQETSTGGTRTAEVLLSTRTTMRRDGSEELRDIQRFNTGFQGSSVVIQGGGSRQPVDSTVNAEIPFDYPEIEFENEAVLQVRGLPYRAYSSGAADNADFTSVEESSRLGGDISFASSDDGTNWKPIQAGTSDLTFSPSEVGSETFITTQIAFQSEDGWANADYRIYNETEDEYYPTEFGYQAQYSPEPADSAVGNSISQMVRVPKDISGDTLRPEMDLNFKLNSNDADFEIDLYYSVIGKHTHDPNPGIIAFPNTTPSGVDVLVNGSTVATDIGSGAFETEVDISGELTRGAWNDIELSSDSLGHIQATISVDGYKQIGRQ